MHGLLIVLRLFHIISAVFWVGGLTLLAFFFLPALNATGASGVAVMKHLLNRTKFLAFVPTVGLLTVLSGFGLYWEDTSLSAGAFARSPMGMTLGIGGLAGLIALIVGGAMAGKSAAAIAKISTDVDSAGGTPSPEQAARIAGLRERVRKGTHMAWGFMFIALVAMSVARYV